MRIAGAQFFDSIRSVIQAEKAREKEKNGATDPNDANGNKGADTADEMTTPEDIEKSTLMGVLFPVVKLEENAENAAHPAENTHGTKSATPKPGNSVDIYV
jgi:hypothetical protein